MSALILRPYQSLAVEAVKRHWANNKRRVLLVAPTGAGKTALAEEMIVRALARSDGADVWFLAHRVELLEQPARRFQKRGIDFGIVKAGVSSQAGRRVQIASVQTLRNRPVYDGAVRGSALVFVDEGHRVKAATYAHIIRDLERSYSSVYIVYLTATPYRLDGQGLGDVTDALVEAATPRQLMDEGFLTDDRPASRHLPGHTPCYVVGRPPPEKIDPRAVDEDGEFNAEAVEAVMDRPKLVGDAVDTWRKHCDGYPGIGRCRTKKSAMVRLEAFKAAGFRVGYLDGETPRRERQLLLARLAIGGQRSAHPMGLDVLLFVNVLTEGFDSESSYDLVLGECRKEIWGGRSQPPPYVPLCVLGDYALTKSMGAFIQFWGRGSRVHRDKPWLRLLSHAGNEDEHCYLSQHESFTLEHRQSDWLGKMRAKEAEQGVAVSDGGCDRLLCADCGTRWLLGTTICLHCGGSDLGPFRSKTRDADEGDEETPGELVEKVPDAEAPRPPTPFETENWFTKQFSWLRSENARRVSDGKRAMKPGVIIHKYRGIFKRDPDFGIYNRYRNQFGFTRE